MIIHKYTSHGFGTIYVCLLCWCVYSTSGAEILVRHLHDCGIPLAVATGSSLHTYQLKVSKHKDVFSSFHHIVCSDDKEVLNGKPSPDIYQTAVKRFSSQPESYQNVGLCVVNCGNVPIYSKLLLFQPAKNTSHGRASMHAKYNVG